MESILEETGACGPFQVCHATLVQVCRLATAWITSFMMFGLYNPGWRCVNLKPSGTAQGMIDTVVSPKDETRIYPFSYTNATSGNSSNNTLLNNNFMNEHNHQGYESKSQVESDEYKSLFSNHSNRNISSVMIFSNSSYEGSCDIVASCEDIEFNPSSSTIVTEFGLICDRVWIGHVILSVLSIGMLFGAFVWGQVGESFGRKIGMYGSNFVMGIACGLAVLSPVWQVYALCTFFIGFGGIGVLTNHAGLCMEFLTSKWRARVSSIPVWNTGVVCFAVMAYFLRDWKSVHLFSALVCAITCLGFFWTPESLRWLMVHKNNRQVKSVVERISRMNKRHVPTDKLTQLIQNKDGEGVDKAEKDRRYTYLDLFQTGALRCLTAKLTLIGIIVTAVYEVIGFGIQSLPGNFYTNLVMASLVEFPGVLVIGPLANKIGRRWTGIFFMGTGFVSCFFIVILSLAMDRDTAIINILVTTLAFITRSSMQAVLSFMTFYTVELVATAVRNLCFGFVYVITRGMGVFSPYMIPSNYPSFIACFSALCLLQLLLVFIFYSLTETQNRPLQDSIYTVEVDEHADNSVQSKSKHSANHV